MTSVYRIDISQTHGNAYFVNRDETWEISFHKEFETAELAREFVTDMNFKMPEFTIMRLNMTAEDEIEFRKTFMDNPKYLHKIRWFVGVPPKKKIIEALQLYGYNVKL